MSAARFASVADYLGALDGVKAGTIGAMLDFVLVEFPELAAKIAWNLPTIQRGGKYVAGIAAYQRHLTFAPFSPQIMADFSGRLGEYTCFKNCFQIAVDWRMDRDLLRDLVWARLAELDKCKG